jgi:hypothetical protein
MTVVAASRIFASHYQIAVCDDPNRTITDDENWDDQKYATGFAGGISFRMVGTEADLNDHWVELDVADQPPDFEEWDRVTCVHLRSETGRIHIMSVVDDRPRMSVEVEPGDYSIYVAGQNLGVDLLSLGDDSRLSDEQLAARKDLEWYRVFVVPGAPKREGRLKDS